METVGISILEAPVKHPDAYVQTCNANLYTKTPSAEAVPLSAWNPMYLSNPVLQSLRTQH